MTKSLKFIDVFAGCGGLSLGLINAGHQGLFAIERNDMAFETLSQNLIEGKRAGFIWPRWLPQKAMTCEELLKNYRSRLKDLAGSVDLIVGGPPCQGFSVAGKRNPADPRNKLTEQYLELVRLVKPNYLVIENVAGFDMRFNNTEGARLLMRGAKKNSYAEYIASRLKAENYVVHSGLVDCQMFGVPQRRNRFLMICERVGYASETNLFDAFVGTCKGFLNKRNLPLDRAVTVFEAISDLRTYGKTLVPNAEEHGARFQEIDYREPRVLSNYQILMRKKCKGKVPNSLRLANHKAETINTFRNIQRLCKPGHSLSPEIRSLLGLKKHSTTVLCPRKASPTITTLPDDILHFDEPRILTVRECARLQSFPDWYSFFGKYTTGGKRRKLECPRYTQVGNAVPPLLSEAIGEFIVKRNKLRLGKRFAA